MSNLQDQRVQLLASKAILLDQLSKVEEALGKVEAIIAHAQASPVPAGPVEAPSA